MARYKVSVTKGMMFQGKDQEWSNVYCYEVGLVNPDFDALADAIVAAERPVHGSQVSFRKVQVWDVGLPPNLMRVSKPLSGTGSATNNDQYIECAHLVKWPLPRSTAGLSSRQRSLKKYLHSNSLAFGSGPWTGNTIFANPAAGSAGRTYINAVTAPAGLDAQLVSPSGAEPDGPAVLHPYLEHRQFPRGRKEG